MQIFRRAILAFALLAGIAPAVAQVPPPVPALPDAERRISYSIVASTCACSLGANLNLYGDGTDYQNWVEVWLNNVRVNFNDPTFGWTITSQGGKPLGSIALPITDGVLTFTNPQTGTVQIVGARRPRRTSQFTENQPVPARNLNYALTDIIAENREVWDKINDVTGRSMVGLPGEVIAQLPSASARASSFICWDGTGLVPLACAPGLGQGNVVGPNSSTNLDLACWSGVTGRILVDCGSTSVLIGDATGLIDANTVTKVQGLPYKSGATYSNGQVPIWVAADNQFEPGSPAGAVSGIPIPGGRLTLTSATPITTTDVTGATTVYYAPLNNGYIPIYNGTAIQPTQFTASSTDTVGLSVALGSSWASGSAYDWFVGLNGTTPTLCSGPAWSGAGAGTSSRGTGAGTTQLQLFFGLWTNAVSLTCRFNNTTTFTCAVNQCTYVGSSLMVSAGATTDSAALRYLFNLYNQSLRKLKVAEGAASPWTYTLTTWRQANANTADQLSMFVGLPGTLLEARVDASGDTSAGGSFVAVGIGINSATVDSSDTHQTTSGTNNRSPISATLKSYPGLGLQNYLWIEAAGVASGTNEYYGVQSASGITYIQSAITGTMLF